MCRKTDLIEKKKCWMGGLCDNIVNDDFKKEKNTHSAIYVADHGHNGFIGWRLVAYFMWNCIRVKNCFMYATFQWLHKKIYDRVIFVLSF